MWIRSALIYLALLLTAVVVYGQRPKQDQSTNAILEAVFRYQIKQCAESNSVGFLPSDHGKDPSDELMKRFVDEKDRFKKQSVISNSSATNEFIDRESGKFAVLLTVYKLKLLDAENAEVEGSCSYVDWGARGYRYTLEKEKQEWIIKRSRRIWFW